jgi:hypothetical protein
MGISWCGDWADDRKTDRHRCSVLAGRALGCRRIAERCSVVSHQRCRHGRWHYGPLYRPAGILAFSPGTLLETAKLAILCGPALLELCRSWLAIES